MISRVLALLGVVSAVSLAAACGSEDESTFGDPNGSLSSTDGGPGDPFSGQDGGGDGDPNAACAVTSAEAKLTPVNLVVMFDRSGSMGDTTEDPSFDPALRWIPVGDAMKAFFTDPGSTGMNASLTFFPSATNSCTEADYATANVALTALPSTKFGTTIDGTSPKGDTPTRAATLGAIDQAKAILAASPTEKTVIVLVTDGEPYGCGITTGKQSDDEAQAVATEVSKAAIATYVIGVGPSTGNLDAIATAGGTTAFEVQVGNATQTTTQLVTALSAIKGAIGRCDFDIPAPPDGRTIDFAKVTVEQITSAGATNSLAYAADCADPNGWHFDDPNKPSKVLLCSAVCDAVKKETSGKVNVSFRCTNRPDAVK
jgi:hypothetical protein